MKKGDLSAFVSEAVSREVLWRTVDEVRTRNADRNPDEIQALVDAAVEEIRADRS